MDYTIEKRHSIIERYEDGNSTLEDTLQDLAKTGLSPALVHNDKNHWAVSFDGVQQVASDPPTTIFTTFIIEKHKWFKYVRDAVIHSFDEPPQDKQQL